MFPSWGRGDSSGVNEYRHHPLKGKTLLNSCASCSLSKQLVINTVTAALCNLIIPQPTLSVPLSCFCPQESLEEGVPVATATVLPAAGPHPRKTAQSNLHPDTSGDDLMWVLKNVGRTLIIPTASRKCCAVYLTVQGGVWVENSPPPPHLTP